MDKQIQLFKGITKNIFILGLVSLFTDLSSQMVFPLIPLFLTTVLGTGAYTVGALQIVQRISKHKIRDWRTNPDAINRMRGEIDDIIFEIAEEYGLTIPLEEHDAIIDRCIEVAIA